MNIKNEISNAYFNAVDIKTTLTNHDLTKIKRIHGGSNNEDTLGDLIDDLILFISQMEAEHEDNI
jgi:hypothetical protein